MREVLFRGKRMDNGEWVEGHLFDDGIVGSERVFIGGIVITDAKKNTDNIYDIGIGFYEVDPATVGQYTGLDDKNGTKIFEGDIVSAPFVRTYRATFNMKGLVEFHNAAFSVLWEDTDFGRNFVGYIDDISVIGNIHDNPELLGMEVERT